jgi:hypothetical protein
MAKPLSVTFQQSVQQKFSSVMKRSLHHLSIEFSARLVRLGGTLKRLLTNAGHAERLEGISGTHNGLYNTQ